MSKKISLRVVNRNFDVNVDEKFAPFLESQISKDLNADGNNDIVALLQAYVKKSQEVFIQERKIESILKKFEE